MRHNRKIVIGGVALVIGRLKGDGAAMVQICDELDPLLDTSEFVSNAPFKFVSLIIRYGTKVEIVPVYQGIAKKNGALRIAIELDMNDLKAANKKGTLKDVFAVATLKALIDVGKKYHLPVERLVERMQEIIGQTGISL